MLTWHTHMVHMASKHIMGLLSPIIRCIREYFNASSNDRAKHSAAGVKRILAPARPWKYFKHCAKQCGRRETNIRAYKTAGILFALRQTQISRSVVKRI